METKHYSKSTKRGILIFTILMAFLFVFPDLMQYFRTKPEIKIEQWDLEEEKAVSSVNWEYSHSYRKKQKRTYTKAPSVFNPNEYKFEEWMALGLSEKQSIAVLKFLKYPIYSNAELKRIVVIPEELYELIKDSTLYPPRIHEKNKPAEYLLEQKLIQVDINTADLDAVLQAKDIFIFDAKQLIRKRDELGGFVNEEQLNEVWQSTPEKVEVWKKYLVINPQAVRKININTCSVQELADHPYISWNLANSLVKLRLQNGPYKQMNDTKKSVLMTEELFDKLKPYFKIEE